MEDRVKSFRAYLIVAFTLMAIGGFASLTRDKGIVLIWLANHRNSFLDYYFYYITKAGEWIGFVAIGLVFLISSWRKMVLVPGMALTTTTLTYVMKTFFHHERPSIFLDRIGWTGPTEVLDYHLLTGHTSFPSGHSMAAWALFTLTAALAGNKWVSLVCLLLGLSVSLSRVYLMAHFLEDVVMGAFLGCWIAIGFYYLYGYWMRKRR